MTEQGNALLNELNNVVRERNARRLTRAKAELDAKLEELNTKSQCLFGMAEDIDSFYHYVTDYKGYSYIETIGLKPTTDVHNKFCFNNAYKDSTGVKVKPYFAFGKGAETYHQQIRWKDNTMSLVPEIKTSLLGDKRGDYTLTIVELVKEAITELDNIKASYNTFIECVKAYIEQKKGEC